LTVPPALVDGAGVDEAAVVGAQLPLVDVGQANGASPLGCAADVDDEEQAARPTVTATPTTAVTPNWARRVRTPGTGKPPQWTVIRLFRSFQYSKEANIACLEALRLETQSTAGRHDGDVPLETVASAVLLKYRPCCGVAVFQLRLRPDLRVSKSTVVDGAPQ